MVPSLKQTAQGTSLLRSVFPDGVLFTFSMVFLIASLVVNADELALSANPVNVTRMFIILHALLQVLVLFIIIPRIQSGLFDDDYAISKKKGNKVKTILKSVVYLLGFWIVAHFIGVIFGAPLVEQIEETNTWAALITCLVAFPALCILGPKPKQWITVFNLLQWDTTQKRTLFYTSMCVIIGTWASAAVIPLDWDRPWQKWPVPGIIGALGGYLIGLSVAMAKVVKDSKFSKIH